MAVLCAGLTEGEVAEGEAAKKALQEEAGQADGDGSDDENFKKSNQFGVHMSKKTDAVSTPQPPPPQTPPPPPLRRVAARHHHPDSTPFMASVPCACLVNSDTAIRIAARIVASSKL